VEEQSRAGLPILTFPDAESLEAWLGEQPAEHKGIWLKLAKKGARVATVSQSEAVDAGLCFGWIDGLINRFDEHFYLIRFTPRRPKSKWSLVNVERAEALIASGRVRPGGLRQIEAAKADGRWGAAYPPASRIRVPEDLQAALAADPRAHAAFAALKSAERYSILYRLHALKDMQRRAAAISAVVAKLQPDQAS
jgi:uncharacterized protein YdeI (YjbR/CyaY-like superfamily)